MKRSTTVFVYTENYAIGGGNKYLIDFVNAIPNGFDVTVAYNRGGISDTEKSTFKNSVSFLELPTGRAAHVSRFGKEASLFGAPQWTKLFRVPVRTVRLLLHIVRSLRNKGLFSKVLTDNGFEIVIGFNGGYPAALTVLDLMLIAHRLNIPTVLSVVSMPRTPSLLELVLYRNVPQAVRLLVANSSAIIDALSSSRRFRRDDSFCVPNRVVFPTTLPLRVSDDLRPVVFGYVGRVEVAKGIEVLIHAFASVLPETPKIRLRLIGDVSDRPRWERQIEDLGIKRKVDIAGFHAGSIEEVLRDFDVFVFPSLWEGLPYALIEAMGSGLPVIATDVGGISEVVRDGIDGFVVKPNDPEQLTRKMLQLSLDSETRLRMGSECAVRAREMFDPQTHQSAVEAVLARFAPSA